ncbi:MAG: regulatory protein TetR [Geminicoccaceae bacterium]|nr:regulatory protein TetR [Geminicoccaceae bacterium]
MSQPAGAADALSSPTRSSQPGGERRLSTPERILHAAAARIVAAGTANLSMQDVADAAGVSKGLIHYHFHDKETLLTRLIEWMTRESIERESATLARSVPKTAVDDLWTWVAGEIDRGHLRVLNELAQERGPLISDAIRRSARARREAAALTVDRLFALLELRPRVPVPLLADVIVAFIDGLAIHASLAPEANHRVAFDVLWLSLLSLAE